jgi:hypothetical protein
MKKTLLSIALFGASLMASAQYADFELPLAGTDTSWFGQDQTFSDTNHFKSGGYIFESKRTISPWGNYSSGWSYSNITDTMTTGSSNQYSAFAKGGVNSTENYAICNISGDYRVFRVDGGIFEPTSVQATNATYTATSMRDGDMFAAQFGDVSNASGGLDSLVLSVYALGADSTRNGDSVNFYLSDFTDGNSLIVDTWENVDLSSLGSVYGLSFGLTSSDVGMFGMNTPAYFAIDELVSNVETADFEDNMLDPESAWYGQDKSIGNTTYFEDDIFSFENYYSYNSWGPYGSGWSYSNNTDVTTEGSSNQYSAITGEGLNSDQYAICNVGSINKTFEKDGNSFTSKGAYITNTTFAYLSMLNGDAFGTQFGDVTNAAGGEDWFLLTIYGLNSDSSRTTDSVNFYLADYRFTNDEEDYLVNEWEFVNLSSLGTVYGYEFGLSSSDTNAWGMLTPSYFALDILNTDDPTLGVDQFEEHASVSVFPNPTNDLVNFEISNQEFSSVDVYNLSGMKMKTFNVVNGMNSISLSEFGKGMYVLSFNGNSNVAIERVVVK